MRRHVIYLSLSVLMLFTSLITSGQNIIQQEYFIHKDANSFMNNVPLSLLDIADKIDSDATIHIKADRLVKQRDILQCLNISPEYSFSLKREKTSFLNTQKQYKYYQQYYKGVKVESGGYILAEVADKISHFSPNLFLDVELNVSPEISERDITEILTADSVYQSELIITDRFSKNFRLV